MRREISGRRNIIIEEMMIEGLTINIFGPLGVGLENDVGAGLFESFLE